MRLKALRMTGFKSFAQKTELHFPDGLTCIVGPNGCGKSNVVDAIKWVLGEQRPKALRGSEMGDVIFGGTTTRRPMGMAEVTLVVDNSERRVKLDFEEVEVSRRLYRDGTSEYLLNKNRCRLKDIREVLMDTGSGPGAMTIMEQGRIDQILRESHHERRAVFEEAAGISRYRARRKESLRRLERVEADLLRLSDVVTEKQRLVRSLKIQAGRAERYQALIDEMRKKRLALAVHRYGKLLVEREDATARVIGLSTDEEAAREGVRTAVAACRSVEDDVETARTAASRLEQRIASLEGQAETAREKAAFAARLISELDGKIRWYTDEIESSAERLQEIDATRGAVAAELAATTTRRAAGQAEVVAAETRIAERAAGAAERRAAVEALERQAYESFARRSALESQRSRLEAEAQGLEARQRRQTERLTELRSEVETATERRLATAAARDAAGETARTAGRALDESEHEAARLEAELDVRREEAAALDSELSSLRSRIEVLDHLCRRMEGVAAGARKLVAAARDGHARLTGVRGLLVELIETDAADAAEVESALGAYASAVVVETFADAETAADVLVTDRLGRCVLVPLDGVRASAPSVKGSLASRVRCDAALRDVVDALLGQTVRVETLEEARAARARGATGSLLRVVTAGGAVLEATGAVTAGGESGGAGIVQRRSELRELTVRATELTTSSERARAARAAAQSAHDAARSALVESRDAARRADAAAQRARADDERAVSDAERHERERDVLATSLSLVDQDLERARAETFARGEEIERLTLTHDRVETDRTAAAAAHAESERALRESENERAEARVNLASVVERCASLEARSRAILDEVADLEEGVTEARSELVGCESRRHEAEERGKQAHGEMDRARAEREQSIISLAEVRHRLSDQRSRLEDQRKLLGELESQASDVARELQKFRLRQNEASLRVENLVERLQDELEVDLHSAWESRKATAADSSDDEAVGEDAAADDEVLPVYAEPVFDAEAIEKDVQELKGRIGKMGAVNLEALEQLQSAEAAASSLLEQHDDLTRARQSLLDSIKRIDTESRELFLTTFEAVRAAFREMFRRLFGGGKADIFLDEGQDVLEAGIDIVARPPGKELRSISLLSGGERTMTAVALLFAIYQSKPSPFCLLDEVDAALDEANVERFANVVKEFSADSQFIIITHNKRTMGVAETIVGVSMPEPGVSRKIAVRLDQVDDDGEIRAA